MATAAPETVKTEKHTVACDGDQGPLGHPRVFLKIGPEGRVECPYCDRLYILDTGKKGKAK